MKIATWNVNSIRTRLNHVVTWLQENPVDALCLQETKVIDGEFPRTALEELGYFVYVSGQKSYNGVAILSKQPLSDVKIGFAEVLGAVPIEFEEQKRLISGVLNNVRIISVYVPNGGEYNGDKYYYKLQWLKVLYKYLEIALKEQPQLCICGDFNIAPDDRDIHFKVPGADNITGTTTIERQALKEILELGLADAFRKFTSEGGHYSWWDYRTAAFRRNAGWRIDHHYLSEPLYQKAIASLIDITPRKLEKPSDHTPVIVEIAD